MISIDKIDQARKSWEEDVTSTSLKQADTIGPRLKSSGIMMSYKKWKIIYIKQTERFVEFDCMTIY